MSNAPSKPVSFSRPKVGYFSNRPRILVAVTSEKQQNCSSCDKCQKNCRSVVNILAAVTSENQQNCSNCDKCQKNCRSAVSILVALTSEKQQNCCICGKCQKNCRSVVNISKAVTSEKQENSSSNLQLHDNIKVAAVKYKVLVERETKCKK